MERCLKILFLEMAENKRASEDTTSTVGGLVVDILHMFLVHKFE